MFNACLKMERFEAGSWQHGLPVLIIAALCAAVVALGRGCPAWRRPLTWLLAAAIAFYAAMAYYQRWQDGYLAIAHALPLHLCDVVVLVCLWALISPSQLSFELAYFWGLGGALQALLTPDLQFGFPDWYYLEFFLGHGVIFLTVAFLIGVQGCRPRSPWAALIGLNVYAAIVGSIDALFGWNYGYLCRKAPGSLMEHLGPWPWYILSMDVIAALNFLILNLPWRWIPKQGEAPAQRNRPA